MSKELLGGATKMLCAAWSELNPLTDALIEKMKAPASDTRSAEASKAFEALFLKSGAVQSACDAVLSMSNTTPYKNLAYWISNCRYALTTLAAAMRESPTVVIGAQALEDEQRVADALALLDDLKKYVSGVMTSFPTLIATASGKTS